MQCPDEGLLRFRVQSARRFVEDENGRIRQKCPRNRYPLPLSTRKCLSTLTYNCVIAIGRLAHKAVGCGQLRGSFDFIPGSVGIPVGDIVGNATAINTGSCGTIATARRTDPRLATLTSVSPRRTTPANGSIKRGNRLASVVFPAPEGPMIATISPGLAPTTHRAAPGCFLGIPPRRVRAAPSRPSGRWQVHREYQRSPVLRSTPR